MLGPSQLLAHAFAFRDVADRADHADGPALVVELRHAVLARPADLAVDGSIPDFAVEGVRLALEMAPHRCVEDRFVLVQDMLVPLVARHDPLLRHPQHLVQDRRGVTAVLQYVPVVDAFVDRLHRQGVAFLALAQSCLRAFPCAEVGDGADHTHDPPVLVPHADGAVEDPAIVPRGVADAVFAFQLVGSATQAIDQRIEVAPDIVRVDARPPVVRSEFAAAEAEQVVQPVGNPQLVGIEIPVPDAFRRCLDDEGVALLALAQIALRLPAFRDVDIDQDQAAVRQRVAPDEQVAAVREFPFRPEVTACDGFLETGLGQGVDIARPVVAGLGVGADDRFQRGSRFAQGFRITAEFPELRVGDDELEIGVEDREALVDLVDPRQDDIRQGRGRGVRLRRGTRGLFRDRITLRGSAGGLLARFLRALGLLACGLAA